MDIRFDCIRTFSGHYFDVFNPDLDLINIEDIATGLSQNNRFVGQTYKPYNVAQHSVLCARHGCTPHEQLQLLMHDASEAYLCDMPSPHKKKMRSYRRVERRLMKAIAEKFGFDFPFHSFVKDVDMALLRIEWKNIIIERNPRFAIWPHDQAKNTFLEVFHGINNRLKG